MQCKFYDRLPLVRISSNPGFPHVRCIPTRLSPRLGKMAYASTQRPGLAVGARKQLARTVVPQNALRLRVPVDLAPRQERDETQVPGNGGMMRHFHRRHRGPARLGRIEEVAKVSTLGQRQFHLALRSEE